MAASIDLKWGNIKGWSGMDEGHPARAALEKYLDSGQGLSAMQRQTDEQRAGSTAENLSGWPL